MAVTDVEVFEKRAIRSAKVLGRRLEAHAINKLNKGLVPQISLEFLANQAPLLSELMLVSYLRGRLDVRKLVPKSLALAEPPIFENAIEAMRKTLGGAINLRELEEKYNIVGLRTLVGVSDRIEQDIRSTAYDLIARGAHVRQAKKELKARFDALGLTPRNSFQLENIFRTASAVAYGAGTWAAYHEPDIWDILWGYNYSTVKDNRVRPNHKAAEGTILPKEDEFWTRMWPPNGYSCRCEVIPLFNKHPIRKSKPGAVADPGFGYNPGMLFDLKGGITDVPIPTPPAPTPPLTPKTTAQMVLPLVDVLEVPTTVVPERIHVSTDAVKHEIDIVDYAFNVPTREQQQEWAKLSDNYELSEADLAEISNFASQLSAQTGLKIRPDLIINTDPELLLEWMYSGAAMTDVFPEILENTIEVATLPRSEFFGRPDRSIPRGRAFRNETRIELLNGFPSDYREEGIDDINAKWHPQINNTDVTILRSTPIHELGHYIGYKLDAEDAQDYNSWARDWAQNTNYVGDNLARYPVWALRNNGYPSFKAELVAESMVQIMLQDKDEWSLPVKELYRILKKRDWTNLP
jgi:SPP1 gp7 family putative phage head morphogenesis protein